MVGTTFPVGSGGRRTGHGPGRAATFHVLGTVVGGAAIGAALGALGTVALASAGPWVAGAAIATVAGAGALYALHEAGLVVMPAPQRKAQVPARWGAAAARGAMGFSYGIGLGAGLLVHVTVTSLYVVVLWALAGNSVAV